MASPSPLLLALQRAAARDTAMLSEAWSNRECSLRDLLQQAASLAHQIGSKHGDLSGQRVLLSAPVGLDWVRGFFATLMLGALSVPVSQSAAQAELDHQSADSQAGFLMGKLPGELSSELPALPLEVALSGPAQPVPTGEGGLALLLYTSGTTGKPKGALISHENLAVQTALLKSAWGMSPADRLLHTLPLHHVHGITVALLTALVSGTSVCFLQRFDLAEICLQLRSCTVWMTVPTMTARLLEYEKTLPAPERERLATDLRGLRLLTSGSAALPVPQAEALQALTGAIPLERYGMTEVGIVLSNPLDGGLRELGSVGHGLPGVELDVLPDSPASPERGELRVRGATVFAGYWGCASPFDADGWFRTGDIVMRSSTGSYRMLGRASIDILKSGGEKVSALEVEAVLLAHPAVLEAAVVGLPDAQWGERVVAVFVAKRGASPSSSELREWLRERLSPYKVPKQVFPASSLPRNAMGKLDKPALKRNLLSA